VDILVEKHAHTVSIDVFNVGKTIPEEDLTRIFKLGVTDRSSRENRGLGLFLSRAHAQTIRGTIDAINRENGVSFVMTLTAEPIESPASPRDTDHSSPALA
jgi:sensor histidine kinase regulating citrate/malate metabolism